tara:strand:- start:737 stop:1345 length:609 start_codon:yes stop_codon:yes gene_type:complete
VIEALYKKIIITIVICFSCILSSTNTTTELEYQNYIFSNYIPYQESKISLGVNIFNSNNSLDYIYIYNNWFTDNLYLSTYIKPINEKLDIKIKYNFSLGFAYNFKDKLFNNLVFKIGYDRLRFSFNSENKNMIYSILFNIKFQKIWLSISNSLINGENDINQFSISFIKSIKNKFSIQFGSKIDFYKKEIMKTPYIILRYHL